VKRKKKQVNKAQKEFFEEFDYKPKWPRFLRKRHFPQRQMSLRVTYERVILFAAAFCLLLVISFCLGVERGKRGLVSFPNALPTLSPPNDSVGGPDMTQKPSPQKPPKKEVKLVPAPPASDVVYSIQVATYLKKDAAEDELLTLKKDGFPAYMTQMGRFYLLTVGDYSNKQEAKKVEGKLKIRYNDCFIKKRRFN